MALRRWSAVRTGPTGDGILDLVERCYPKRAEVYVTSGIDGDHGKVSHHYGLHHRGSPTAAIDFGVGANARMGRDLAKWIEDEFGDLCVELIHTTAAIAGRYKTTVPALVKLNPVITNPDLIQIDQRLRVK